MATTKQAKILAALLAASVAINVAQCSRSAQKAGTEADTVTVVRTDTVHIANPGEADTVLAVRTDTVRLPIVHGTMLRDTVLISKADTVRVAVPITQAHYADSAYEAWVSGYRPRLDSIRLFNSTVERTVTNTVYRDRPDSRRWSVSLQAGYGITPKGAQPYVGVGVGWSVWMW